MILRTIQVLNETPVSKMVYSFFMYTWQIFMSAKTINNSSFKEEEEQEKKISFEKNHD